LHCCLLAAGQPCQDLPAGLLQLLLARAAEADDIWCCLQPQLLQGLQVKVGCGWEHECVGGGMQAMPSPFCRVHVEHKLSNSTPHAETYVLATTGGIMCMLAALNVLNQTLALACVCWALPAPHLTWYGVGPLLLSGTWSACSCRYGMRAISATTSPNVAGHLKTCNSCSPCWCLHPTRQHPACQHGMCMPSSGLQIRLVALLHHPLLLETGCEVSVGCPCCTQPSAVCCLL
jgi:hypothetical protein